MQRTPIIIRYEGEDEQVHTVENGYECDDPDCPCHGKQSCCDLAQEQREAAQDRNATTQLPDGSWW